MRSDLHRRACWEVTIGTLAVASPAVEAALADRTAWIGHGLGHAMVAIAALTLLLPAVHRWPSVSRPGNCSIV